MNNLKLFPRHGGNWRGTKGHAKDKSRLYETWFKAIRQANKDYAKSYYHKIENDIFKDQLRETEYD